MTKTLKKSCASFLSLVMLLSMLLYFPSGTFEQFSIGVKADAASITPSMPQAGDGSADSPYEISTAAELYWFADKVNNENDTYKSANAVLTANIVVNTNVLNSNGELNSGTFEPWTSSGSSGKNIVVHLTDKVTP